MIIMNYFSVIWTRYPRDLFVDYGIQSEWCLVFTKHGVIISFKSEPTEHNTALEEGNIAKEHLTTELTQAMPNSETASP